VQSSAFISRALAFFILGEITQFFWEYGFALGTITIQFNDISARTNMQRRLQLKYNHSQLINLITNKHSLPWQVNNKAKTNERCQTANKIKMRIIKEKLSHPILYKSKSNSINFPFNGHY